jgi:hypothetical protein
VNLYTIAVSRFNRPGNYSITVCDAIEGVCIVNVQVDLSEATRNLMKALGLLGFHYGN